MEYDDREDGGKRLKREMDEEEGEADRIGADCMGLRAFVAAL